MDYWLRMWREALRYLFQNVKEDGLRRALTIFWKNWKARTHLIRTHVPPGVWCEPNDRITMAIEDLLIQYVEDQLLPDITTDEERYEALKKAGDDDVFADPYIWFKRDRARLRRVQEHHDSRYDTLKLFDKLFRKDNESKGFTPEEEHHYEKSSQLSIYAINKDHRMLQMVIANLHKMWT